jgi:hypothetical protein
VVHALNIHTDALKWKFHVERLHELALAALREQLRDGRQIVSHG